MQGPARGAGPVKAAVPGAFGGPEDTAERAKGGVTLAARGPGPTLALGLEGPWAGGRAE